MKIRVNKVTFISILIVTFIIVLVPFIYLYYENVGFLGEDTMKESIGNIPTTETIVKVYSDGQLLYVFEGYYSVIDENGDFTIIRYENDEEVSRINTYGHISVVELPASEEIHAAELQRRENE